MFPQILSTPLNKARYFRLRQDISEQDYNIWFWLTCKVLLFVIERSYHFGILCCLSLFSSIFLYSFWQRNDSSFVVCLNKYIRVFKIIIPKSFRPNVLLIKICQMFYSIFSRKPKVCMQNMSREERKKDFEIETVVTISRSEMVLYKDCTETSLTFSRLMKQIVAIDYRERKIRLVRAQ